MNSASLRVPKSLKEVARPDRCALVVYDMQVGILSQLAHGPEILSKVLEVLEIARGHGFRIVFLRHMSLPTKLAGVFQLRQAMAWQRVGSPEAVKPRLPRAGVGCQRAPGPG